MKKIIIGEPITITFDKKIEKENPKYEILKERGYLPYQIEAVKFFDSRNGVAINADDMGLGKTAEDIGYCIVHEKMKPILIICPSHLKINWSREIKKWAQDANFEIIYGTKIYTLPQKNWYIINYDILTDDKKTEKIIKKNKKTGKIKIVRELHGWYEALQDIPFRLIIIDECHYLGNGRADRTIAVNNLFNKLKCKILPTSGTPIKKRPLQFFPILHMVDPLNFSSEWKYKMDFCDPVHNGFGWEFKGASNIKRLSKLITPIMIRRMKRDKGVLEDLPAIRRIITPLEPDVKLLKAYHNKRTKLINNCGVLTQFNFDNSYTEMRKLSYMMKMKAAKQWITDYIETEGKLIIFAHHISAITELENTFSNICVSIYGKHSTKQKMKNEDKFNNDLNCKLCIYQIQSAVGSNMTAASAVAFLEFGNSGFEHSQAEDRIDRLGQKAEKIFAYYFVTEGTDDLEMMTMIEHGDKIVKQILSNNNKSKFFKGQVKMFNEGLLEMYRKKRRDNL